MKGTTTLKQIEANRRNAIKSTGPVTEDGKTIVSKNALKHGLLSQASISEVDEKKSELANLFQEMCEKFKPEGELEKMLVDRIASCFWRLKRSVQIESAILSEVDRYPGHSNSLSGAFKYNLAEFITTLNRYESMIERSFYKALHELQRVQAERNGLPTRLPIAIDVAVEDVEK